MPQDNTWELRSNLHPELIRDFEMAQEKAREAAPPPTVVNAAAAAAAAILARTNADLGREAHEQFEIQAMRRCMGGEREFLVRRLGDAAAEWCSQAAVDVAVVQEFLAERAGQEEATDDEDEAAAADEAQEPTPAPVVELARGKRVATAAAAEPQPTRARRSAAPPRRPGEETNSIAAGAGAGGKRKR